MEEQKQIDKRLQALVGQNKELQERVAVLERQNGTLGDGDFGKDRNGNVESLEQYRNIIENSNAAIGVIRADGTLLMINRTGASLLDSIPERLCNRNIAECVPRELSEMALKGIRKVVTSRKGYKKERMIHIDREDRWIDANVQPVRDLNGEVTGIQFIILDITERKKTESSLRGRVKELNCLYGISRLLQRRGNTLEDILHGIVNLIIPSWEYPLSTCARIILEGLEYKTGNFSETIWKQSRDIKVYGEKRGAVEVYYLEEKPERYEGPFVREERDLINAIGDQVGRFIERIRVEGMLNIKESAIESSINAIALADLEGNLTYVNPSFITMWGFEDEREVLEKSTLKFWQKEEDALNVISNMKKSGAWVGEMNAQKKDGSLFVTQLSASVVKNGRGEPVCMMASFVDTTERKNIEKSLEREKKRAEQYLDIAGVMFAVVDKDETIGLINKKGCDLLGYNAKELIGRNWFDILIPRKIRRDIREVFQKLMSGDVKPVEYYTNVLINKKGEERLFSFHNTVIKDKNGQINGILSSAEDVTERVMAEEALRNSEQRFKALIESTSDWIWEVDENAVYTYVSPRIKDLLGFETEEVIGKTPFDLMSPDEAKRMGNKFADIVKAGKPFNGLENVNLDKNGRQVIIETSGVPISDVNGDFRGYRGIDRDITERRKAEETIKESEIRYRALFEGSADGIIIADVETKKFEYVNESFCKMLGHDKEAIRKMGVLDIHPKESLDHVIDEFMAQANGEKTLAQDIPCLKKDGTILYADINTQPLVMGGRKYNVGFFRDITERKRAEKENAALEDQLRQGEKLRAVGELAGGIAHDFNNMLGAISGYADLIEETNKDEQGNTRDEDLQKRIAVISRASGRAADLVAKLLAFSRRGKFRNMPIDIHELVNDVIALLESSVDRKITLEKRFTARDTIVKGDFTQIQNAILNICINACDVMKNGGVLKISTENMTLHKGQYHIEIKAGNYIKLSVRDTGCGMDREMLGRIFEPFYTTKEVGEGTGLGLSSALGTMQSHNGYITVESVIDKGTTFNVYIPLATLKGALEDKVRDKKIVKGTGTILVVDDEDMLRELVEDMLVKCGYTVHTFGDSVKAVSWYKKNYAAVDLVLLDMVMPKMDGLDCFDKMREVNSDVKVVLASGYSRNYKVQKLLDRGVIDFIEKPFDRVILSKTIARVLKNGHASEGKNIRKEKVVVKQGKGV